MKTGFLTVFLIFLGFSVWADNYGLMRVSNLPANDTLNVREGPTTGFAVIGELQEGQIVDSVDTDISGRWALINFGEGQGWVATRYLEPQTMAFSGAGVPIGLSCGGTEPFWSYDYSDNGETGSLAIMGLIDLDNPFVEDIYSVTRSNNATNVLVIDSEFHTALLIFDRCSDGMSDRIYPWTIHLRDTAQEGALWSGCCSAAPPLQ